MLSDWVIEWFIGGNSSFCEGCLFNYTEVNDTYAEDFNFQPRSCTDCIPLDGISRAVAVVNRQMPGPAVQVGTLLNRVLKMCLNTQGGCVCVCVGGVLGVFEMPIKARLNCVGLLYRARTKSQSEGVARC